MTITVTENATATLTTSLHEQSFWENRVDGFWYPIHPEDEARARVRIEGGVYTIQTRRSQEQPWTLLVKALVSDFDPVTFRTWCAEWPLRLS
jgi:hypothetical protein